MFTCQTKDIESTNSNITETRKKGKNLSSEDEKIVEKINQTYLSLETYQDEIIFRKTFKNPGSPINNEEGKFYTFFDKSRNFKFYGSTEDYLQSNYLEVLRYDVDKFRVQLMSKARYGMQKERNLYKYNQIFNKQNGIGQAIEYSTSVTLLYQDNKNFKNILHKNENAEVERLGDVELDGKTCYRFSVSKVIEEDSRAEKINIDEYKNDTTLSKEVQEDFANLEIYEEFLQSPDIEPGSGIKIVYWFRKDDYLLVKTESRIITSQMECYEVINYKPIINKNIDDSKFVWSEKDKR
jgi:hypothetical protein